MNPTKIDTVESTFATNLKDSNGVTHSLVNKIDIGNDCCIKQIRPNFNSYYYTAETKKTAICLHFTVGNLKGDIGALTKKDNKVSVFDNLKKNTRVTTLYNEWCRIFGRIYERQETDFVKHATAINQI